MALQKNIILSSGAEANYIKVSSVRIYHTFLENTILGEKQKFSNKIFEVSLHIYKDISAREDKQFMEHRTVRLTSDFNYNHNNILPAIYTLLKTRQEFSGALDV